MKIINKIINNESCGVNKSEKEQNIIFCPVNWTYVPRRIEEKV